MSLLGQGTQCRLDPALRTPGSALATYWEAVQLNDMDRLAACSLGFDEGTAYPGMLWAFPSTRAIRIEKMRFVPVDENRVVASYDVRFRPLGAREVHGLSVVTELVRARGEWRVARPLAEQGLLSGKPQPTRVDI